MPSAAKVTKKTDVDNLQSVEGSARLQAISIAMQQIEKEYGKGSIMKMGDSLRNMSTIPVVPTGSLSLDLALGVGGYPKGRMVEIYGPEASGKTTLCLHAIANVQKEGGVAAFIDVEHAMDPLRAQKIGVNLDELLISQPDYGEQALEIAETLIFTNQIRMKIGVMFGSPETTTGGNALKFYASQRIDIRKIGNIQEGEAVVGSRHRVRVKKNKVAPPFAVAEFDMDDNGISLTGDVVDVGVQYNIIEKSGSFFKYKNEVLAQGREATKTVLAEKPALLKELKEAIWAVVKTNKVGLVVTEGVIEETE